jgi:hypothetical protein
MTAPTTKTTTSTNTRSGLPELLEEVIGFLVENQGKITPGRPTSLSQRRFFATPETIIPHVIVTFSDLA